MSTPQIPSHTHTGAAGGPSKFTPSGKGGPAATPAGATGATGGGGSHTHPFSFSSGSGTFSGTAINLAVKYLDVITATKD